MMPGNLTFGPASYVCIRQGYSVSPGSAQCADDLLTLAARNTLITLLLA